MKLQFPGSLHDHSEFSNLRLRDCIVRVEDLLSYANELGHEVVALTDHETISGHLKALKAYKKIKEKNPNFKLILGNEIYLCRNGLNANNFISGQDKYFHFILLAKDPVGHQQIREISTRAWTRSYMARGMRRVPTYYQDLFDIIGANPGHVIGATACLGGALGTQLLKQKETNDQDLYFKIGYWCQQLNQLFGQGNFYLEMQPSTNKEQVYVNNKIIELSEEFDIPFIITTDTHYLKKEDRAIHKAYLNAQNGDREVDDFYATTYLMNTEELESYMKISEDNLQKAYQNILNIKNMCEDYSLEKPLKIPQLPWKSFLEVFNAKFWFDKIPYLEKFYNSDYIGDKELFKAIVNRIMTDKTLQNEETYLELNENLKSTWISSEVNNTHWSSYFLNLQKIIDACWEAGSLVGPGRGSGAGFLLLYVLGITQINPLREETKCFGWRFLNPERVSVLDIDTDIESGRRGQVLEHLRKVYGYDRVAGVATFGTEKAKSAILTAARGLGIDVDIAQYLSSMIESDRGQQRTLHQTFYGDDDKGFYANKQFVFEMTENYPELWAVAQKIEGLVCRMGVHAGGVIFVDEPFTNSAALMRAPDGTIITQFELHDAEELSLIKYDLLSVNALDRIHNCIDLLCECNQIEKKETLKETYENVIGVYNLERTAPEMWKMVQDHKIMQLFQMEQQSGIQGIALAKPTSVKELAVLNSVIRLMAPEKGAEQPLDMWSRYREDISYWHDEMRAYGLTSEEIEWLSNHSAISDGICESQEGMMSLIQEPRLGGHSLTFADSVRKGVAKKVGKLFDDCQETFYKTIEEKGLSTKLGHYVWDILLRVQRGYSFCRAHTLSYSLIALQEMNLAYKFSTLFWNCACLIADSGGAEREEDNEDDEIYVGTDDWNGTSTVAMEDFIVDDESEDDEEDDDNVSTTDATKKKKTRSTDYGRIATAIGKMKSEGIDVAPPNINKSAYTFSPDVENNVIIHGLSGITRIGEDIVKNIIEKRPFVSLEDFLSKVKVTKPQMVNLIKCGAFDELCGDRIKTMKDYILMVSEPKKRVTLQNMRMLIDFNLLPESLDFEKKVFNFNKYIKKTKDGLYYLLDEVAFRFYEANFDTDLLVATDNGFKIKQVVWDDIYKKHMDKPRTYIKAHSEELLAAINQRLFDDLWDKYCSGTMSKWEMDSVSYYSHEHELSRLNNMKYGFSDFFALSENPDIDTVINIKGKQIPLFRIYRIAGTVLDKDKAKKTITLLTTGGVVTVKMFGPVFVNYDKQISEVGADGHKHVIEPSWLSRGNKIIITGIRRDENFVAKKYSRTPFHLCELITGIDENGNITTQKERYGSEEE